MSTLTRIHVDAPRQVVDASHQLWPTPTPVSAHTKTVQSHIPTIKKIAPDPSSPQSVTTLPARVQPPAAKLSWVDEKLEAMRMTPRQQETHSKKYPLSSSEKEAYQRGFDISSQLFEWVAGGGFLLGTTRKLMTMGGLGKALTQGVPKNNSPYFALTHVDITPTNAAQNYKRLNSEYRKQLAELKQNPLSQNADRATLKQQRNTAVASIQDQLLLSGHYIERGQVKPFASHAESVERWMRLGAKEDVVASRYVSGVTPQNIDDRIAAAAATQHNMGKHVQTLYKSRVPNQEAHRDAAVAIWNATDKALTQLRNLKTEWNKKAGAEIEPRPR